MQGKKLQIELKDGKTSAATAVFASNSIVARKGLTTLLRMIWYFADVLILSDNKTRRQEAEGETFLKNIAITVIYLSFFSRRRTISKAQ